MQKQRVPFLGLKDKEMKHLYAPWRSVYTKDTARAKQEDA